MGSRVINQTDMRDRNLQEVFQVIRDRKSLTRRELQAETGLSWGGTSQIVSRLLDKGLIIEETERTSGPGRSPSRLTVNSERNLVLGIDINESGLTAVVMNLRNELLEKREAPADYTQKEFLLKGIWAMLDPLVEKYRSRDIFAIGISMQGALDETLGISIGLRGCPDWKNVPLKQLFTDRYQVPVYLAHDPDCLIASNVTRYGEDVILFRVDYNIGMSVFRGGFYIKGPGMLEIGDTYIRCSSGAYGPLSRFASIKGLEKRSGMPIRQLAADSSAEAYFRDLAECLSEAIVNATILFHIPTVLICGKIMEYKDYFWDQLTEGIYQLQSGDSEFSRLYVYDEKKAAFGAALLAIYTQ